MPEWFKKHLTLYSTEESRAAGKLSILAIFEIVLAITIYWWIAAVWQTHLHIVISLFAAPLYLFRSEASIVKAQSMWDSYLDESNGIKMYSLQFWLLMLITALITGLAAYWLSLHWLSDQTGWAMIWRSMIVGWLIINTAFAVVFAVATSAVSAVGAVGAVAVGAVGAVAAVATVAVAGAGAGAAGISAGAAVATVATVAGGVAVIAVVFGAGLGLGMWLRSIWTRIVSVLQSLPAGFKSTESNWRRTLLIEDSALLPELVPEIKQPHGLALQDLLRSFKEDDLAIKTIALILMPIYFLPTLLWRFSLKSTAWFYLPIFLMSRPGELRDTTDRQRFFTRAATIWESWKVIFAAIGLLAAVISTVDKFAAIDLWRSLSNEAPLTPLGWFLVLDWQRFFNQPWQWFSFPAACLTVLIYLWVDGIRKDREADIALGKDPDEHSSHIDHPGITLYWLDRIRNALVIISLIVGLWYFVAWAYAADKLTPLNLWLSSVFGPLSQ